MTERSAEIAKSDKPPAWIVRVTALQQLVLFGVGLLAPSYQA